MNLSEDTLTMLGLAGDLVLPLVLLLLGWGYKAHSASVEDHRARSRIAAEWRLEVFKEVARALNDLLQFYTYVGKWAEMTPDEAIATKRRLDHLLRANRFLWSSTTLTAYDAFAKTAFVEGGGRGTSMQLRANVDMHADTPTWNDAWRDRFVPSQNRVSRAEFLAAHDALLDAIVKDLGLLPDHV